MALVETPGAANANTYATVAEYKAFWQSRPQSETPLGFSDPVIETGLMWACALLDATFRWNGSAVDGVQALTWPRSGMLSINKFSIPTTVIPQQLKNAQCMYAGILLSADRTEDDPDQKIIGSESQVTSIKAGSVALSFAGGNFTTLEAFDAFVRSLGSDMAYLQKSMPDGVRLLIPPSWYQQASLKRKIIFGAF